MHSLNAYTLLAAFPITDSKQQNGSLSTVPSNMPYSEIGVTHAVNWLKDTKLLIQSHPGLLVNGCFLDIVVSSL